MEGSFYCDQQLRELRLQFTDGKESDFLTKDRRIGPRDSHFEHRRMANALAGELRWLVRIQVVNFRGVISQACTAVRSCLLLLAPSSAPTHFLAFLIIPQSLF